jgi:hypothetical protein
MNPFIWHGLQGNLKYGTDLIDKKKIKFGQALKCVTKENAHCNEDIWGFLNLPTLSQLRGASFR